MGKQKRELFWKSIILFLLAVYLIMFGYLNLAKYNQHVDSDIATEALLAREMWIEKSLTPDNWISSTERRILGMPFVAALIYGMTGNMTMSAGIACVLIGALLIAVIYWFLRKTGLSRTAVFTALLILCAVPINGLRNSGQIVPFVSILLFLFADYYAFHSILMFLSITFYLHLKKGNAQKKIS